MAKSAEKHGGGHVRSARALRYLFASGILSGHGTGKGRTVRYSGAKRAAAIKKLGRGAGGNNKGRAGSTFSKSGGGPKSSVAVSPGARRGLGKGKNRHNHYTNAAKSNPSLGKSGAGLKAAHLRGGSGKADHSATRAARIAAGKAVLERQRRAPGQKALRISGYLHAIEGRREGMTVKQAVQSERTRIKSYESIKQRRSRIDKGLSVAASSTKSRSFKGLQDHLGREGAIAAVKNRSQRIASGKAKYAEFSAKRTAEHGGGLFQSSSGKVDHSATRAARIEAGRLEAAHNVHKLTYQHKATETAKTSAKRGMTLLANTSSHAQKMGFGEIKVAAAAVQRMKRKARKRQTNSS